MPTLRRGILTCLLCLLFGTPLLAAERVHLSVAASMAEVTGELIAVYQAAHPEVTCLPNVASSGALAKQIVQGAPADLFISAHPRWMSWLVEERTMAAGQVRVLAGNALVFVARRGLAVASLADVVGLERIAIGSPGSVPAGQYAEQALQASGLFAALRGKLVMAQDVRQALVYADRGEVDGAFVYRTDARLASHAVTQFEVPQELYERISYPVGLTEQGAGNPAAQAFYKFLETAAAAEVLKKHGFAVN